MSAFDPKRTLGSDRLTTSTHADAMHALLLGEIRAARLFY
jgi:hypothetical protein